MTQRSDGGPNVGDLRVWHIPQIPMSPFHVPVQSPDEAVKVMQILADYDIFQFENRVKPDYCNASGLEVVEGFIDGEPQWIAWQAVLEDGVKAYNEEFGARIDPFDGFMAYIEAKK